MRSEVRRLPQNTTQEDLLALVDEYNNRSDIHGLLVQFPLPAHLSQKEVLERIAPAKRCRWAHSGQLRALASGLPGSSPVRPGASLSSSAALG